MTLRKANKTKEAVNTSGVRQVMPPQKRKFFFIPSGSPKDLQQLPSESLGVGHCVKLHGEQQNTAAPPHPTSEAAQRRVAQCRDTQRRHRLGRARMRAPGARAPGADRRARRAKAQRTAARPHRTAPQRMAPHRTVPYRSARHGTGAHRSAP